MGCIKNILIIQGTSQYAAIPGFIDEMKCGFENKGCTVDYYYPVKKEDADRSILYGDYDLVLSFFGVPTDFFESVNKNPNTLFYLYLQDHPYYRYEWLTNQYRNVIVACVDRNHCDFLKTYYKNLDACCFLPHGGNVAVSQPKDYEARSKNVVFFGTLNSYAEYEELEKILPAKLYDVIQATVSQLLAGIHIPAEQILLQELKARQIQLSAVQLMELFEVYARADTYVRAKQRELLITGLEKAGLEVDVYGNGWNRLPQDDFQHIRFHGAIPYTQTLEVMADAKIVLNKMPLFFDGSHDRVVTCMLNQAVCFTDASVYLQEQFQENETICFYDDSDIESLAQKIRTILEHPEDGARIAKNGYEQAMRLHKWENRAEQILEQCAEVLDIEETDYSLSHTATDYAFNRFLNYMNSKESDKIKHKCRMYVNKLLYDTDTYNAIQTQQQKRFRLSIANAIETSIESVKQALGEYAWLYSLCKDAWSKRTLLGLLQYWVSYEYRYIDVNLDKRYTAYADFDVFDMKGAFRAVFLSAVDATSIQAIQDYYQSSLEAVDIFVPNKSSQEAILKKCKNDRTEITVCENETLKQIDLDCVFDFEIGLFVLMETGCSDLLLEHMEQQIRNYKPKFAILLEGSYDNLWKLPNLLNGFREDYRFYIRCYSGGIAEDKFVLYAV